MILGPKGQGHGEKMGWHGFVLSQWLGCIVNLIILNKWYVLLLLVHV